MAEEVKCACGRANVGIFACSGSSNVGQIANKIAIELTKQKVGKMMCTVGIGGRINGLLKSAEGTERLIAIDGCPLNCTQETLKLAGFSPDRHIVISEFGIKKNKELELKAEELEEVMKKIKKLLQGT
ncbi:MAG: putative zinc-binding protein [Methanosarcinaceae archaeon]|nr:putative zinc-binding protein [Methanosarcinaceae archaeon]MDD4748822.1 putative zinc-binding protein [Methanosarcinaceae archaeon]